MIHSRKLFVVASLVAASIAMAATDGINLRKTLQKGTESYHVHSQSQQTITIPGGGDQEMGTTTMTSYSYDIGAVDAAAGQAPVDLTAKIEKFDMDGPMAEAMAGQKDKLLVTVKVSGKLDSRNRFTTDPTKKIDPRAVMMGTANSSLIGPFIEFPEKAINIGDSWDVTIAKGPTTFTEDQKITAKLVAETTVDGKAAYTVEITGKFKTYVNVGELMKANPVPEMEALGAMDMVMTGSIEVTGEATIDKETGKTLTMTIKLKTKQETSIAALGDQKIPSTGTSTVKITLDK